MKSFADFFKYQSYQRGIIFTASLLPVCFFSTYVFAYFLFYFLHQKKYAVFITGLAVVLILNLGIELIFHIITRPYTCPDCDAITFREEINIMGAVGINVASFLGVVALGIKFTKNWYLQQVRNRILAKQKITNELKLLKGRIQPRFLFKSLQALYYKIGTDKNEASQMLLKFSELLSYMLYECTDDFASAKRELVILQEYIELENITQVTKLTIVEDINDNFTEKYIPSFILLSLLQNCVIALYNNKHKETNLLHIKIYPQNNFLICNINIQPAGTTVLSDAYAVIINTFKKRLQTFYKNNYTLELVKTENEFLITMSLLLITNFSTYTPEKASENKYTYEHV